MQWRDEGIIVGVRAHGETAAVVDVLTRENGRHGGLVHGGRSRRLRPTLQIGNHVDLTWKGRLAEHLGQYAVELRRGFAAVAMQDAAALSALSSLSTLTRLLAEREPHPNLYEVTLFVLGFFDDDSVWPALMVRWETALLGELGFGLELDACAATGATDDLVYVSPRTGRAVSRAGAGEYADRLLPLPSFMRPGQPGPQTITDVLAGYAVTGHFLESRVLRPQDMTLPEARQRMLATLADRAQSAD